LQASLELTSAFHVRILIPCYTEALEIVKPTLLAAAAAALPQVWCQPFCRCAADLCKIRPLFDSVEHRPQRMEKERTAAPESAVTFPPQRVRRSIYLCDDGKDPIKEAWVASLELDCPVFYIRGHVRAEGEVNGKSGNLNNALSNVIFPPGTSIGGDEVRRRRRLAQHLG
jgi:hypothetical protein